MSYEDAQRISGEYHLLLEREEYLQAADDVLLAGPGATVPKIDSRGVNNTVIIGSQANCVGANILIVGNNSMVVIGANAVMNKGSVRLSGDNAIFWFGAFTSAPEFIAMGYEGRRIIVGDECLISNRVMAETSDHHPIFDNASGLRINPGADVHVGNNVWLGRDVRLSKGATIGANSMVGQGSVVTRAVGSAPHTIYAGSPAKALRTGITTSRWQADSLEELKLHPGYIRREEQREALLRRCDAPWLASTVPGASES